MFDSIPTSSRYQLVVRIIFSIAVGFFLTVVLPWLVFLVEGLLWPSHAFLTGSILWLLSLPGAVYCALFKQSGVYESDPGTYCFLAGLLWNIPLYSLVVFVTLTMLYRRREKKLQAE
jgi:hypothetical protein